MNVTHIVLTIFPCSYARSKRQEYSKSSKHFCKEDIGSLKYTGKQTRVRSFPTLSLMIDQRLMPLSFSTGSGNFFRLSNFKHLELQISFSTFNLSTESEWFSGSANLSMWSFPNNPQLIVGSKKYSFVSKKLVSSSSDASSSSCFSTSSDDSVVLHSKRHLPEQEVKRM